MNSRSLRHFATASGFLAVIGLAMNCAAQSASLTGLVKGAQGIAPIIFSIQRLRLKSNESFR
jgi:hypothetical protein